MIGVGDFVLYWDGESGEVGRVAGIVDDKHVRVCYHLGETSALTYSGFLSKLTPEQAQEYSDQFLGYDIHKLGGGRFD